jgi:hypothetical protein
VELWVSSFLPEAASGRAPEARRFDGHGAGPTGADDENILMRARGSGRRGIATGGGRRDRTVHVAFYAAPLSARNAGAVPR